MITVWAGSVLPEASPGRADGRVLSVSSHGRPAMRVCVLMPSSDKDPAH